MPLSCRSAILILISAATLGAVAKAEVLDYSPRLARTSTNTNGRSDANRIDRLISQLGSERYFDRRHAEEQLIERGADVFDQLQEAEEHPDLEIATRAHYILQRIRVEWTRPDDSTEVRAAMEGYGELSRAQRLERMDLLSGLVDGKGVRALCRIARFEPSGLLARNAALAILRSDVPRDQVSERIALLGRELGDAGRAPVEWLRTYAKQLEQPEQAVGRWQTLIDEEITSYEEESAETNVLFIFRLLSYHLDLCRNSSQPNDIFSNLSRRIELCTRSDVQIRRLFAFLSRVQSLETSDVQVQQLFSIFAQKMTGAELAESLGLAQSEKTRSWLLAEDTGELFGLAYALNWLFENEQWEALELVEDHYEEKIPQERLLLYLTGAARWKQGRNATAEEFAERAYKIKSDDAPNRDAIADMIGEMGRHDWAEREWWFVVEEFPVLDSNSMSARRNLALLRLHDRGEDRRAAELMAEISDALEADPKLKRSITRTPDGRYLLNQYHAQRDYFLACQAASEGKHEEQRTYLESACDRDSQDPDILIAMYRLENSDEEFRKQTVLHIQQAVRTVEGFMEQEPDNAQWYNHWAWLVSNTEGDYDQAVEHSLRSLELSPDSPSYLDTLGRCHYAAGELEEAVRVQREAVRRHPHLRVMRDQLELFETTFAEHPSKRE